MNIQKIIHSLGQNAPELNYVKEVAQRLGDILGDNLSYIETIALIDLISLNSIRFRDGFIVNDDSELVKTLGYALASIIGSVLCIHPDEEPYWWKDERLNFDSCSKEYEEVYKKLLEKIDANFEVIEIF